jgi:hypothetical protein
LVLLRRILPVPARFAAVPSPETELFHVEAGIPTSARVDFLKMPDDGSGVDLQPGEGIRLSRGRCGHNDNLDDARCVKYRFTENRNPEPDPGSCI